MSISLSNNPIFRDSLKFAKYCKLFKISFPHEIITTVKLDAFSKFYDNEFNTKDLIILLELNIFEDKFIGLRSSGSESNEKNNFKKRKL